MDPVANFYKTKHRSQSFLLPPNMMDWLREDDIAYFLIETVEALDCPV
jgi:hypothetical protein